MAQSPGAPLRWNIFARELMAVLEAHGRKLSFLNGIADHRTTVQRLQKSLTSPGHLVTLNPEEMKRLFEALPLRPQEKEHLQAALVATAVEMALMGRMDLDTAYRASDNVFTLLTANPDVVRNVRGGSSTFIDDGDMVDGSISERALHLLDRALLTLHIARGASPAYIRRVHAQESLDIAAMALELLERCRDESEEWKSWSEGAGTISQKAQELLDQGEEEH
jgi:hypothetical protein